MKQENSRAVKNRADKVAGAEVVMYKMAQDLEIPRRTRGGRNIRPLNHRGAFVVCQITI